MVIVLKLLYNQLTIQFAVRKVAWGKAEREKIGRQLSLRHFHREASIIDGTHAAQAEQKNASVWLKCVKHLQKSKPCVPKCRKRNKNELENNKKLFISDNGNNKISIYIVSYKRVPTTQSK